MADAGTYHQRETYLKEYHELTHKDGVPFVPGAVWKDMIFSAAILFAVALCAVFLGPFGPTGFPDPTIIQTVPKPDFFFLVALHDSLLSPGEPGDAVHIGCSGCSAFCSCWRCRSLPARGRRAGTGGRSRCCRSLCLR